MSLKRYTKQNKAEQGGGFMTRLEEVLALYPADESTQSIMRVQTAHRLRLIDFWGIRPGDRVLEIGCGQGDTTAALACTVGANGFVHGVDVASPDYGMPETLGQAKARLAASAVGGRLRIDLETDLLSDAVAFRDGEFDVAVLSHCLWYLNSRDTLVRLLRRVRPWAKRLCVAEWDPRATAAEQLPHLQAVTIQAVCESFYRDSRSNVRTLFYPADIRQAVEEAGYVSVRTGTVSSPDLPDGAWEIAMTREDYPDRIVQAPAMPDRLKQLLLAQIHALPEPKTTKPLSAFVLTAD